MICCWRAWFCCWRDWSEEVGSFISWDCCWVSVLDCWDVMAWDCCLGCCCCLRPPVACAVSCWVSLSEEAESSASGALMEREKEAVRRRWFIGGFYAHCFVGAGGFLGPSLGGDFCAILCLQVGQARIW